MLSAGRPCDRGSGRPTQAQMLRSGPTRAGRRSGTGPGFATGRGARRRPSPAGGARWPAGDPLAPSATGYDPRVDPAASEPFDLDLAAATLQANSSDVRMLLHLLVDQLGEVLGKRLTVQRNGGRFRRGGEIQAVEAAVGDDVLRAELDGSTLRCTVGHASGGIRIRTDTVAVADWIKQLLAAVQHEAQRSEAARQALERIVIGGPGAIGGPGELGGQS